MAIQRFKPTKVPIYPAQGVDFQTYVQALHPSLYTAPSTFVPSHTGITGITSIIGAVVSTARSVWVAVQIKGASLASEVATISVPLKPIIPGDRDGVRWDFAPSMLNVSWVNSSLAPSHFLDDARIDKDGTIFLPPWDVFDSTVLVYGMVVEA